MSKSNVNPNHYKVAGRERQGEDIAQARNKQKHAESKVRLRAEAGARCHTSAPKRGASLPDAAPTRSAKTATRKARATLLQAPPGQKRAHNLVPGSSGPHARFPKTTRVPALQPTGAAPQLNGNQATLKARVTPRGADNRSKRSTTQKRTFSRDGIGRLPTTGAVVGVFGQELSRRRPRPRT